MSHPLCFLHTVKMHLRAYLLNIGYGDHIAQRNFISAGQVFQTFKQFGLFTRTQMQLLHKLKHRQTVFSTVGAQPQSACFRQTPGNQGGAQFLLEDTQSEKTLKRAPRSGQTKARQPFRNNCIPGKTFNQAL